jgi:hypothetical protein
VKPSRGVRAISRQSLRARYAALTLCACIVVASAGAVGAAPYQVGGGFDYYSGPADQITRTTIAIGSMGFGHAGSATMAALRYDDSQAGTGAALVAGMGLPMAPLSTFQLWGYRYIGDETFRGWRLKAGPQIGMPGGSTLGLFFSHYEDNSDVHSNGGIGELNVPLVDRLTGSASVSFASAPGDLRSTELGLGLSWQAARSLELSGEVGLAQNGALTSALLPSGTSSSLESITESTYQVGVRVMFP